MEGDGGFAWLWAAAIIGGPVVMGLVLAYVAVGRWRARKRGEVRESQQERLDREPRQ